MFSVIISAICSFYPLLIMHALPQKWCYWFVESVINAYNKYRSAFVLLVFLILYFTGRFFVGSNGWINYVRLNKIRNEKAYKLNKLEEIHHKDLLEINGLGSKEIDLDYLDELARAKLNYAKPNEIVIIQRN